MTGNNRNLLIDGDFQAVDLTSGHSGVVTDTVVGNYTSTVPTGWSSSTGGVGDFAPTATPSPAFAGSQVAYLGSTSQLSQSFGTGPGNSGFGLNQYLISLDIGTRADIPPLAPGTATIVATVGSTVIGQVTYTATAATAGEKTHLSFVTADLSALGLAGQNVTLTITDGTDTQILVDNVVAQSLNPNFLTDGDFQSVNLNPGAPGVSSDSGGSHTGTAPTGWTSTVAGAGAFAPNSTASTAFAGAQVGYIVPNGSLSQSFTPTVVTGGPDPILISLDLGTRIEAAVRATSGTVTITASVGATVIGQTIVNASSLTAGGETHLSFATSDLNALGLAGQNVTLSIANATNGQILIDNVVAQGPMVFSVTDEASLNAAIKAIDASGADAVNGAAYQINITGPISLTSALDALNLPTGASLTIAGMSSDGSASQVQTIDGGGAQRGFFVYSGNVTFENLIIQNTLAKGGNGADSGGGGAGLGGGLFVANDTWNGAAPGNVTLVNVSFGNDKAQGGNGDGVGRDAGGDRFFGGGGGLGQDGLVGSVTVSVNIDGTFFTTYAGGGGGIGSGSGAGIVLGARGGGVGGDSVSPGSPDGGVGGTATNAGGGGGGVGGDIGDRTFVFQGGHGGFGGGGGAGRYGGVPNFGGNGGFGGGGGGGASNQFSVGGFGGGGGGGASGSPGGFGAGASLHGGGGGLGAGGDIFVMQGATLTIAGGTLADGTVTGGTGAGGALNGTGFGAGIFIEGNQSVTFGTGQTAGQTTTIDGDITDQTGSHQAAGLGTPSGTDRADGTSNAGTGSVIITGSGTVVLDGDNTYTGDTTVQGGTLQITAGNNLGSGKVALNNGTQIDMVVVSGSATLSNAITGAGQFVKDGAGTAVLGETGGANTYTGGTVVQSGTLVLADDTSTGSGSLTLENGTAVDLTGIGTFDHPIALNGDPTIEVDSGTTTDTGVISGAGGLVKIGAGTLALNPASGSNTYSGGARVDAGTLAILSGTATSVTVSSGGTLAVAAGGGANGAVVTNGGALTVSSGGSASGATVSSGGTVTVFDGGTLAGAVGNDGTVTYDISGTATFGGTIHALTSGGTLVVSGGGALDVVSAYTGAAQLDDASTLEFTSAYVGVATFSGAPTGPGGTLKFDAGSTGPINVANPNDTVIAQPGNNNWINAAVTGNSANDTFVVYNSADVVIPQAGSHDLVYSAVNYILPTGVDSLVLEAGTQAVGNSDAAGDTLYAANAGIAQTLTGNSANDTFVVYNSGDTVIGQAGSTDTVYAAVSFTLPTNVDTLFLEGGSATQGTGNSDTADALYGNAGVASTLAAGSGADVLYVTGAAGTILTGAAGHDTFAFPNVMGHDEVTDFGIAKDMLQFNATLFSNFTAAMNAASQVGANTVFTIDTNDTVTLDNVTKSSLTSSNFHFT